MTTTFFYHPEARLNHVVVFDASEATHITKAMRLRNLDPIDLTNGKGGLFSAVLRVVKHHVSAQIVDMLSAVDTPVLLHLGIAPTKNADRMEWLVEKAVEMGIGKISLLSCKHSERARLSMDRLERVAISALKQSRRTILPTIHEATAFDKWLASVESEHRFIAHCAHQLPRVLLRDALVTNSSVCIAIGPEGDFSEAEIEQAIQESFRAVSLGTARLRTETAALAAVHTFNLHQQISLS